MSVRVRFLGPLFQKQEIPGFKEYQRLLDSLEPRIFRAFTEALSDVEIEFALVRDLFEQGNVEGLMRLIGFEAFERRFAELLTPELETIARRGSQFSADRIASDIELPSTAFNVVSEDVLLALQTQSARIITGIGAESRAAVRRLLVDAYRQGRSSRAVAMQIGDVVGLTERQAVAVGNFSRGLDDVFEGIISESEFRRRYALSPRIRGQRENIIREYTRRQVRHRGEMIARTETITAFSRGRHDAWGRMQATGAIPQTAVMEWLTSPDERACPICIPLHGEQATVGGAFSGGFAMPPAHVGCRCDTRVILNPENVKPSAGRQRADAFLEGREEELLG